MSLASFGLSEMPIAQPVTKRQTGKPPPKRTIVALSDANVVAEAR